MLIWWHLRHVSPTIFARYSNSMETLPCCNSVAGHQIATIFCKICKILLRSCIRLEVRVKRYFHQIWIAMENPLVKRGPGYYFPEPNKQLTLSSPCITFCLHDDVIKWKHFPRHWPFVRGIHRWRVNSPHKGQWRGALVFSLICVWINGWVNNREAGNLRGPFWCHCNAVA